MAHERATRGTRNGGRTITYSELVDMSLQVEDAQVEVGEPVSAELTFADGRVTAAVAVVSVVVQHRFELAAELIDLRVEVFEGVKRMRVFGAHIES